MKGVITTQALKIGYRAVWALLFASALLSATWVAFRNEVGVQKSVPLQAALGFVVTSAFSREGLMVSPFGRRGRALGVDDGDLLLAVDGQAMTWDRSRELMEGGPGQVVRLTLRHQSGLIDNIDVVRDPAALVKAYAGSGLTFGLRRNIAFALNAFAAAAGLAAALLLFLRRPRDPVAQLLGVSLLLLLVNVARLVPSFPSWVAYGTWEIGSLGLAAAIVLFPDGRLKTPWHWLAMTCCVVEAGYGVVSYWSSLFGGIGNALRIMATASVLVAVIVRYRVTIGGVGRQQLKSVLFGFVAAMLFYAMAQALGIAETASDNAGAEAWIILARQTAQALFFLSLQGGLLVALLRYRLYDAEATISRSAAYGALTIILLAVFAGSERVVEALGEAYLGESLGALAGGIGAATAAVMLVPLHHRLSRWAEHRFQKQLIDLKRGLPPLMADLRQTASLEGVAAAALDGVKQGVRATRAALLVRDTLAGARGTSAAEVEQWRRGWTRADRTGLDCDRTDPLFPVRIPLEAEGHGRVGWLLLGPRPDGSFYGKEEREALAEVADPVARAVEIARMREEQQASSEQSFQRQQSEINKLANEVSIMKNQLLRIMGPAPGPAAI